jgi:hypothetical protein
VKKELTEEQKAKVFKKFDLNMFGFGDNGSQGKQSSEEVWMANGTGSDVSPLPVPLESVDILCIGNEFSV